MPKILCIGGTGHVGGAVLHKLLEQHAEENLQVKVLVRDEDKSKRLVAKYPRVETIIGHMEEHEKVEAAARDADIVINTAPDISHNAGIEAILAGLKGHNPKSYYIHTSGASLIWDEPEGLKDARLWDDIADIGELSSLKEKHTHAVTDIIVRNAASDVNVAIVSPGFVGGLSPSIEHPTPITTPAILTTARAFGSGFQIAQGENASAWIHVNDLTNIFLILIDDAIATLAGTPIKRAEELQLWGPEAYYFGTEENIVFSDFMQALTPVLLEQGVVKSGEIRSVNVTEAARISLAGPGKEYDPLAPPPPADSWAMHISVMYGINMRIQSSRMKKLGWEPEKGALARSLPDVVSRYLELEKQNA
ncbi:hypothetical protein N0V93_006142 [Gnomoniopsis smithogilvyi]|uniref:NAD(P)-binding domain-containing protein n=1 Tax=Gnomoniopsis smithogilvyi TaxID=1191159 RepID=A0A9W9CU83_9PEZI|nr:hypothetical protein N0V93_006142 [Gnomoniopsis smithogilvyi]